MTHKITVNDVLDALHAEIVIASFSEAGKSSRKLTYNVTHQSYDLNIAGRLVWSGDKVRDAVQQYNEFDAGLVDYTIENLAYAGI